MHGNIAETVYKEKQPIRQRYSFANSRDHNESKALAFSCPRHEITLSFIWELYLCHNLQLFKDTLKAFEDFRNKQQKYM